MLFRSVSQSRYGSYLACHLSCCYIICRCFDYRTLGYLDLFLHVFHDILLLGYHNFFFRFCHFSGNSSSSWALVVTFEMRNYLDIDQTQLIIDYFYCLLLMICLNFLNCSNVLLLASCFGNSVNFLLSLHCYSSSC